MFKRLLKIHYPYSFFLFGPRGTGKSFWLKNQLPNCININLLDRAVFQHLKGQPHRLLEYIPAHYQDWIIIDEVQKIPELLDTVHLLIEDHAYKFILTGSSARKLRRNGINLLAGRARRHFMYPLTAVELGEHFSLGYSLQYGHLPSVYVVSDPADYLDAYVGTYLQEEVMQEGLLRDLSAFSRFLTIASFSQGSLLNMNAIAREVGVDQKTIGNYFTILEDLLLAIRLPVFTKRAKRQIVSHPKFYYFDVGVYRSLRPKGPLDMPEEINGIAVESLILQELRAINDYFNLNLTIYFWRTSSGAEVDFVLYGELGLFAIEVKSQEYVDKKDYKHLIKFKEDYPAAKLFLLYTGKQKLYINDINVLPIAETLPKLQELFL